MTAGPEALWSLSEIAAYLDVSPAEMAALHRQRRVPTFHLGGSICATKAALDDWRMLREPISPGQG